MTLREGLGASPVPQPEIPMSRPFQRKTSRSRRQRSTTFPAPFGPLPLLRDDSTAPAPSRETRDRSAAEPLRLEAPWPAPMRYAHSDFRAGIWHRLSSQLNPNGAVRENFTVARDGTGIAAAVEQLRAAGPVRVLLGAKAGFEVTVAARLAGTGLPLVDVDPA